MTALTLETALPRALQEAQDHARAQGLGHAGGVRPPVAWALVQAGQAVLVDVRTAEERKFVGQVPGTLHVAWATGTALTRNPRFARELEARLAPHGGKEAVALLLCRSGKRSVLAAQAAAHVVGAACARCAAGRTRWPCRATAADGTRHWSDEKALPISE